MSTNPERKEACLLCRFYEDGLCKRYPRQFAGQYDSDTHGPGENWYYPPHDPADWCGEFQDNKEG